MTGINEILCRDLQRLLALLGVGGDISSLRILGIDVRDFGHQENAIDDTLFLFGRIVNKPIDRPLNEKDIS